MDEESTSMLGTKKMNYDFLLLVRDKKYVEALMLGKKILEFEPNNPSIKKFCDFITANNQELKQMVEKEKEEEEYESVESGEQEESEEKSEGEEKSEDSNQDDEDQQDQEQSEQQQEEEKPKKQEPKKQSQLTTCTLNQIPHSCPRNQK